MAHTKVSIVRKWYGKIPPDRNGDPIPKELWRKRRKHSWEVRWYSSDGKRYSKSFKSRKEANEYAKHVQGNVDKGKSDKPRKITLAEFIEEHKEIMVGQVAYSTLQEHRRALDSFGAHVGEDRPLAQIRPSHAESFVSSRLIRVGVATVNKDIRTLKSIFNRAIEPRRYLAEGNNPFASIKERKNASPNPYFVPLDDLQKVFPELRSLWWRAFLIAAYTSGCRKNELLHLTWVDVDFAGLHVHVCPKRPAENTLAWEPKDHERRVIPVPKETIQILANLQAEADENSPYVFLSGRRLAHILEKRRVGEWTSRCELVNNVLTGLKKLCRKAGVKVFCLHDLRRTCITNWAQRLPIQVVKELAGHSSIETTQKYYLSVQPTDMVAARDLQSKLMTSLTNY